MEKGVGDRRNEKSNKYNIIIFIKRLKKLVSEKI
jgi:hypothetical protein